MHVIQLRGPWEREPAPGRVERFDWERDGPAVFSAEDAVTVIRRFGCPSGMEPGDQVRLMVAGLNDVALTLNDRPLDAAGDIAALLLPRNVLRVTARGATDAPQVRLEIVPQTASGPASAGRGNTPPEN